MVLAAQSGTEDNTVWTYEVQYRRSIRLEPKSQCFPLEFKFNTKPVYTGANTVYCTRQNNWSQSEKAEIKRCLWPLVSFHVYKAIEPRIRPYLHRVILALY